VTALMTKHDTHTWVQTIEMFGRQQLIVLRCACGDSVIRVPAAQLPSPRRHRAD
jgi:hypothetical protein